MSFNEKDMQDILVKHPEIIEKGMRFVEKEQLVYGRRVDLHLKDSNNNSVIVELKNTEITYEHVGQLIWYTGALIREGVKQPRSILVGTKVHPALQTAFDYFNIEWRELTPGLLISYLKDHQSDLYSKYATLEIQKKQGRSVKVSPREREIPVDQAKIITERAYLFKDWLLKTNIPPFKLGPLQIIVSDTIEDVEKNTGYWIGKQRRFSIQAGKLYYDGTVYFGSSGGDGKAYYLEETYPVFISIDIGTRNNSEDAFKPSTHTHGLKLGLHNFIDTSNGEIHFNIPVQRIPEETKEQVYTKLTQWEIPLNISFKEKEELALQQFYQAIIGVAFLKLSAKQRIKFQL